MNENTALNPFVYYIFVTKTTGGAISMILGAWQGNVMAAYHIVHQFMAKQGPDMWQN